MKKNEEAILHIRNEIKERGLKKAKCTICLVGKKKKESRLLSTFTNNWNGRCWKEKALSPLFNLVSVIGAETLRIPNVISPSPPFPRPPSHAAVFPRLPSPTFSLSLSHRCFQL
ncbi:hypothetical protein ACOSQ4_022305 [Xanthoceras sorbifolium]